RIGLARRGVAFAHAVHGGRELRVYVRERDVDDLTVVEMSTEIAHQIAEEMTFPGQIKGTVIRALEATATANVTGARGADPPHRTPRCAHVHEPRRSISSATPHGLHLV